MKETSLAGTTERILLYVDDEHSSFVAKLQATLTGGGFHFEIRALDINPPCNHELQSLLLIACSSVAHATSLSDKYGLLSRQVYWLLEKTKHLPSELTLYGHWFIDWRSAEPLQAILSLLKQHSNALQAKPGLEHKVTLLSDSLGELSLTLSAQGKIIKLNPELLTLMGVGMSVQSIEGQDWLSCLHIPSSTAKRRMQQILADVNRTQPMSQFPPFPIQLDNKVIMADGFIGPLHNDETLLILRQISSVPSQQWSEQLNEQGMPVTLLLVKPDGFSEVISQYGRELADIVLDEIMQSMCKMLRLDDFASRYSGDIFAAHLANTNEQQGQILAARMLQMLHKQTFSQKKIKLEFSFGLASLGTEAQWGEQSPVELFHRANNALQSARGIGAGAGAGNLLSWEPRFYANIPASVDRMSGKFSDAPENDFRLITLQWDIIRLIGSTHSIAEFSTQVCQLLTLGLQNTFTGLYLKQSAGITHLSGSAVNDEVDVQRIHHWAQENIRLDSLGEHIITPLRQLTSFYYKVIPLTTRGQCLGVLLLCWHPHDQLVAKQYLQQLEQVIPNLAAAIDRIMLLEKDKKRQVVAQKNLSGTHELLFESPAMDSLMQQVQLVAPTDASVLIIGETGTGKEVIAQQIFKDSLQPHKPFITVDCSTIVENLIESELFGHIKGAFTGAINHQPGLIAQAEGGTLFLDEVSELPLAIQSKLLRFVQEKTYVAVGDQRVRKVNVRLILATNRNLPAEVEAGRFRADLYYRINAFTLSLPPLNERSDDPLLLARHFLEQFSRQYHKEIRGLSELAISKLRAYTWPGNVRELRNCMMRAVILCSGHVIEPEHLQLQALHEANDGPKKHANDMSPLISITAATDDDLHEIAKVLNEVVLVASQQTIVLCVNVWLEKLWLELCLVKWVSLYKVAKQLNKSESTLRRRHAKLSEIQFNQPQIQELTLRCNEILAQLLNRHEVENLWNGIEKLLFLAVLKHDSSQQIKAKLLDVTQPTLRKIIQQV
jgi:diguanylate cyclase (GGDEF)-like protein